MALTIIAGCDNSEGKGEEENKTPVEKIAGEWHCSPSNMDAEIYVNFTADGKFELYQQITEGAFRLYRGTWALDEEKMKMSGKYNDGEKWGSDYSVVLSEDINSMTLTDSAEVEYVYSRQEIPSGVKETSVVVVKSEALPTKEADPKVL